jgi:hypothetical protein
MRFRARNYAYFLVSFGSGERGGGFPKRKAYFMLVDYGHGSGLASGLGEILAITLALSGRREAARPPI